MGRRSNDAYDNALGLRESEDGIADTFEAEFPTITGRTVKISCGLASHLIEWR
jgi:hypothetical protein